MYRMLYSCLFDCTDEQLAQLIINVHFLKSFFAYHNIYQIHELMTLDIECIEETNYNYRVNQYLDYDTLYDDYFQMVLDDDELLDKWNDFIDIN